MSRRCVSVTLDTIDALGGGCRSCVRWELDPASRERAVAAGHPDLEKEAWLSAVLLEWGSCGRIAYVDTVPVGHVLYAPPVYVPRALTFPTSPVSADAVVLMSAYVAPEHTGGGIGRMLLQAAVKDLTRRGVRAVEAFGRAGPAVDGGRRCIVPADYLLAVGFTTVRPHPLYPRLRLEVRTAQSWKDDVEVALERLLGSMHPESALRPV